MKMMLSADSEMSGNNESQLSGLDSFYIPRSTSLGNLINILIILSLFNHNASENIRLMLVSMDTGRISFDSFLRRIYRLWNTLLVQTATEEISLRGNANTYGGLHFKSDNTVFHIS